MKIKKISCEQFAGIGNKSIEFKDGINIIYGKNESGKSTLVNLISRTLFQNVKLDRRSDKDFQNTYFPTSQKGSNIKWDFIDGKITFETPNGEYTLSKEWGADSRCTLSAPEGSVRDQNAINDYLKDALVYGEGVYSDILFSSQKNTDISLQSVLDASKESDAKKELVNIVSRAFAESGGISVDAVEKAIDGEIDVILGEHWDVENNVPKRKIGGGRHQKKVGEILKTYYALKDAEDELEEISRLENEVDRTTAEYNRIDREFENVKIKCDKFNSLSKQIALLNSNKKEIERLTEEINRYNEILKDWPVREENYKKAGALNREKESSDLLSKYNKAKEIADKIRELENGMTDSLSPTENEISEVKEAQRVVASLENRLCGMNITAAFNLFNGNNVKITSIRTGETVDISDGTASVTEAVKITVPDVLEMQLSPADVDVISLNKKIAEQKNIIAAAFKKYSVDSVNELENLAKKINSLKDKLGNLKMQLDIHLGDVKLDVLEKEVSLINKPIRDRMEIENVISALCGNADIAEFITKNKTIIEKYDYEYQSIANLQAKVSVNSEEKKKLEKEINSVDNIPEEFKNISDTDDCKRLLENEKADKSSLRDTAIRDKAEAEKSLESYRESINGDPIENREKAEQNFNRQNKLLHHWLHIKEVFNEQKEKLNNNPMQDIAEHFTGYLSIISGGKVSSEFTEPGRLDMNIYSGNKTLDYGKLSEGTKETVSLAFRLAVLDHLFPNGNGVIILDDPLCNMDTDRTAQSCELIKECAKQHQVIFLTCREEYLEMLSGNKITL